MNTDEIIETAIQGHASTRDALRWAIQQEREACAELSWPTQQIKIWSDDDLAEMTRAFNKAREKHGWFETIMAVGAVAKRQAAAAIRARGNE